MKPRIDPPEAAELLLWASRNGFTTHIVGEVDRPLALVLVKFGQGFIDLAHLRGPDRTEVARVPRDERANIWRPERVTFHYYGGVLDALTALRRLPDRDSAGEHGTYAPPRHGSPPPLTVSASERASTTVRPPVRRGSPERRSTS